MSARSGACVRHENVHMEMVCYEVLKTEITVQKL